MKISLNLVKKYTRIKDDNSIVQLINDRIGAVESVEELGPKYEGIIVAEITEAKPHPDADKLGVYMVDIGSKTTQVVAGDKKLKPKDKVAYIPPGSTVPSTFNKEPLVIEKRELRGQMSNGMLASLKELDFSDDSERVAVLDTSVKNGTDLADVYRLNDTIVEIENKALTHRPDAFGMIGIAREIAGIQEIKFKTPLWLKKPAKVTFEAEESLSLAIDNNLPDLVPRFTARAFTSVSIGPSSLQRQSYLSRLGIKPINNVVDLTNYLMVLTGQPIHAFDYDKVKNLSTEEAVLLTRYPKQNEKLTILGGESISPHRDAILIATDKNALSLGGVIGGENSEVDKDTKRVILEVANFNLYNIRQTSMKHGLFTEAVTRFARGQAPELCSLVQAKAALLMGEIGARVASPLLDTEHEPETKIVEADSQFINQKLGTSLEPSEMSQRLNNIELDTKLKGKTLKVTPPYWRGDINISEDIAEEVGRLGGFTNIPTKLPKISLEPTKINKLDSLREEIRTRLKSAGANEIQTYNFISEELFNSTGQDKKSAYIIRNALSPDLKYIRTNLLPSILDKVYGNIRLEHDLFALFEIGKSHNKKQQEDGLPKEIETIALVVAGDREGSAYYLAKHYLEYLLDSFNIDYSYSTKTDDWNISNTAKLMEEGRYTVVEGEESIGIVGEFRQLGLKLPSYCAGFEVKLEAIQKLAKSRKYIPLSKYPFSQRDLTLATDSSYGDIEKILKRYMESNSELEDFIPIGIYKSKKNHITFRLTFRSQDKTLSSEDANRHIENIVKKVSNIAKQV